MSTKDLWNLRPPDPTVDPLSTVVSRRCFPILLLAPFYRCMCCLPRNYDTPRVTVLHNHSPYKFVSWCVGKKHVEVSVFFTNSTRPYIVVVVIGVVFVCISVVDVDVYMIRVHWICATDRIFNCINKRPRLHFHHYFSYVVLWNSPNWNSTWQRHIHIFFALINGRPSKKLLFVSSLNESCLTFETPSCSGTEYISTCTF